jgi:hypothetical protein
MMKRLSTTALALAMMASEAMAQKQVSIGSVANGNQGTGLLTTFLQAWVTFATGPWAVAMIAIATAIGIAIWVLMPREGPMGWVVRASVGGICLLNMATILTDVGFGSTGS